MASFQPVQVMFIWD